MKLIKVKIEDIEYELSKEELEYLKLNLKKEKWIYESIEAYDVAVYLSNLIIGYINNELFKKIKNPDSKNCNKKIKGNLVTRHSTSSPKRI